MAYQSLAYMVQTHKVQCLDTGPKVLWPMFGPPLIHKAHLWPFSSGPKNKRKERDAKRVCFLRLTRRNWTLTKLRWKTLLLKAFCFPNKKDRTSLCMSGESQGDTLPACMLFGERSHFHATLWQVRCCFVYGGSHFHEPLLDLFQGI